MAPKKTNRRIYFFELKALHEDQPIEKSEVIKVFEEIRTDSLNKEKNRIKHRGSKALYMGSLRQPDSRNRIFGKLFEIRLDAFPELINMNNDLIRSIDAKENEGILEPSHFVLHLDYEKPILALEYNHYGPKNSDFESYVLWKGIEMEILQKFRLIPISRDIFKELKTRINRPSRIEMKVQKDNIKRVKEIDDDIYSAMQTIRKMEEPEYVDLAVKYNYRKKSKESAIKSKVLNILDKIKTDQKFFGVFDKLKVTAEDSDNNDKLKDFDLLNVWVKSEIEVPLKERSKAVDSDVLFEKILAETQREFPK